MTGDNIAENKAFVAYESKTGRSLINKQHTVVPNFCTTSAVLALVLVGELLAFALTLADGGFAEFSWNKLGLISLLVQWVLLASAGSLCITRRYLSLVSPAAAVSLSFAVVLLYTALFSFAGHWFVVTPSELAHSATQFKGAWPFVAGNVLIAAIFSGVLFRYLYIQQRLKVQEQAELGARVQALQSRIRPHFLFNSLNSIASLIEIKPELAEKTVVDLARLFRASLQLPQLVPIEQELELCRCFTDIEKVRLDKRLAVEWRVAELPEGTQVLNLLIQPLLENAIHHGVQPLPVGGTVLVEVKPVKNDVVVRVTNPRLPGSEMNTPHNKVDAVGESANVLSGNGIALSNIRRRLEALYAKKAYLRVVQGEDDFSVIVRYPNSIQNEGAERP